MAVAAGLAIALVGGVAVALGIAGRWSEARQAVAQARPGWLLGGVALAAVAMVGLAWPWRRAMALLGAAVDATSALAWYFVGELGKYVPGGVWTVVGRAEWARGGGVGAAVAYAGVALSLAGAYLGAAVVAVALVPVATGAGLPVAVVVALPLGLAALHPRALSIVLALFERLRRRPVDVEAPSWAASAGLVVRYVPAWCAVGAATWCVARAFEPAAPFGRVALSAVVAWIVGFVAVPVPGGLGVREAVFVGTAGLPVAAGAATAVAARLAFMGVDAVGAVLGAAVLRARRRPVAPAEAR
ncbi:MAG: flippase-like domain-containing protein [Actinobacteria bacterium]|nr:flippase-like domain-containing protein [Actinomycetota bacterium]